MKLKNTCRDFAKEREVENIIKKYSLFISHPIKLNGDLVNNLQAIWYRSKNDVSKDEYQRFYEHVSGTKSPYKYLLHYSSDVPLTIKVSTYWLYQSFVVCSWHKQRQIRHGPRIFSAKFILSKSLDQGKHGRIVAEVFEVRERCR